jgi:hypothetical protein
MRAANVAEKVSKRVPQLLQPFKAELLGLLRECEQPHLRWSLALMTPRLSLTNAETRQAVTTLRSFLRDRSSIVKTFAMQALADLSQVKP